MLQKRGKRLGSFCRVFFMAAVVFLVTQPLYGWTPDRMEIVMPHRVESNHNLITREFCQVWQNHIGNENFKFVNKGGAGGRVGFDQYIQHSDKDGSALLSGNIVTGAVMYAQQEPPWDWMENLVPVGIYAMEPGVLMVQTDSEYETLQDVIEASKKSPVLVGTSRWVQGETLQLHQIMEQTGAQFEIIPFGSGGATRAALLGGHVDMISRKASGIKKGGGKFRALSISMEKNIVPDLIGEDVPTTDEAAGFNTINVGSYRTMLVHKSVKENFPERYNNLKETLEKAKDDPDYIKVAEKQGYPSQTIIDMTPEELNSMIEKQFDTFERFKEHYK